MHCALCAVRCALCVVGCLLLIACSLMGVVCVLSGAVCCLSFAEMLLVDLLRIVFCLLLFGIPSLLVVRCRMSFAVCR